METEYIYFPTAFPFTVLFALFPWGPAHILWLGFTAASLILGAILMWDIASVYAPTVSGLLVGLTLANCELFFILGNPAGIAIGLGVIAVWCFVRERWVTVGVLCMAISLMLKPHDSALVWLCLVLAERVYRKRALQTVLVLLVVSVASILWVTHVAPNWASEFEANLVQNSAHGYLSDPGPKSSAGHGIGMIISLQTVISVFRDNPRVYNPIAYAIVGALILVWMVKTARSQISSTTIWFALAPISALSMLPLYHRLYDAKILMLAIPACAMLWLRGGMIAWVSLFLNVAAILLTGGFAWAIFFRILSHITLRETPNLPIVLTVLQVFPVPLTLLAFGSFYLHIYVKGKWRLQDESESARESRLDTDQAGR
jgi:hypothetical protein